MIETIFRIAVIFIIVAFIIAVLGSTSLNYNIGISDYKVLFTSFLFCIAYLDYFLFLLLLLVIQY